MDKVREIRFLYPPSLFIVSLLLGILFELNYETQTCIYEKISYLCTNYELRIIDIIIALFGGGLFILTFGFFISTITINILRLFNRHYEVVLTEDANNKIWHIIFKRFPNVNTPKGDLSFYAPITFDHKIIDKGIHQWLRRRWNAFNVSSSSVVSLLIALLIGCCFFKFHCLWVVIILIFCTLLSINAYMAWKETMKMLEFQSKIYS